MPRKKRSITAEDLYKFQLIKSCAISPDGENVAYSLHRVDKKNEKKYSNIWIAPTGAGRPRSFTHGVHSDSSPVWSPNGQQLAFASGRADGKSQLYVIPFHGGEARPLTDLQGDFGDFEWSPDGRRIVFSFRQKDAQDIEREADPALQELGVVSRHHTRVWFKLDGYGFLPQGRWHIWTTDVSTGRTRQLTDGDVHDEVQPTWSPDGGRIMFISNRSARPDFSPHEGDLFVIPATGGRMRKIPNAGGQQVVAALLAGRQVDRLLCPGRAQPLVEKQQCVGRACERTRGCAQPHRALQPGHDGRYPQRHGRHTRAAAPDLVPG